MKDDGNFQKIAVSRDGTPLIPIFNEHEKNQTFTNSIVNIEENKKKSTFSTPQTLENYIKIVIPNFIKDKEGFLLFLNKEIMKIYYLSQVFSNLHVYKLESDFNSFELMFLKYLYYHTKKIKESMIDKIDLEISKKILHVLEFIQSKEYFQFEKEIKIQMEKVSSLYFHQKKQFFQLKTIDPDDFELENDNIFNFKRFLLTMLNYIERVRTDFLFSKNEKFKSPDSNKYIIFLNELIDSILIEELFNKFINENNTLNGQKYFEDIRNSSVDGILKLVAQKIEFAKEKYKF